MKYQLQDLIDLEHFQNLQDRLNKIYSFPSSIIDNDGNILTATEWQGICTQFHRKNKDSEKLCIERDQYIKDHIHEANPTVSYRCPHGLVDNATPIIIDGIHYGNFFTGQFFMEKPDLDFFRVQARKYGFDEITYLDAVERVPICTQEQLDDYLFIIKGLIAVMSESGFQKLKEIETRKEIEKRESRHQSILKTAMDGYWLTDTNGRLLEVNEAYCRMSEYSEDELLTMHIPDLEIVETSELIAEHIQQVVKNGYDRFESRLRRKDGTVFDVEVSIQFRSEEGGQCVSFIRDITDRKQAEKALRKSEERYREIVEGTENLVTEVDIQGRLTFINEACTKIWGLSPDECRGLNAFDFIHEDDREETLKKFDLWTKDKPASATFENRQINQTTGDARDMLWSINFVYNDKGEISSIKSIARDITERKRTEQKLIESERKLKDAQKLGRIGYWFWDIKTGEVEWTDEVFKLHGLDPQTFTPHIDSILELSPWPEDHQRGRELIQKAMDNQDPGEFEQRFLRPDGSTGYYLSTFQGIYDENQKLIEMRGTAQDITERKKAEQELKKVHEELETRVEQRTKELSAIVQILKYRNHEIELLNEMGDLLQVCSTENESHKTLSNICKKMWPDSTGFLGIFDKTLGLNTIEAFWGESVQHNDPFSPEECWAFRRGKCHSIIDPDNDLTCEHMRKISRHIAVCVPIAARGKTLGVLSTKFPILGSDADRVQVFKQSKSLEAMAKRVTELFSLSLSNIRLRKDLYERSIRDSLTGLYNRLFMEESLSKELKIAERKGTAVSVIMMDVDHFKRFNDKYGHETGDEVLRRLGLAIPSFLRPSDIVCRYGGEEIIVIMPDCPLKIACDRAELIRSGIEDKVKIRFGEQCLQVTASFGVAEFNENYHSKEEFVSAADQALYLAKQAGRNIVQIAETD